MGGAGHRDTFGAHELKGTAVLVYPDGGE